MKLVEAKIAPENQNYKQTGSKTNIMERRKQTFFSSAAGAASAAAPPPAAGAAATATAAPAPPKKPDSFYLNEHTIKPNKTSKLFIELSPANTLTTRE
jgi:hypothetical protein